MRIVVSRALASRAKLQCIPECLAEWPPGSAVHYVIGRAALRGSFPSYYRQVVMVTQEAFVCNRVCRSEAGAVLY